MLKKLFAFCTIFLTLPVFAGEFEDALVKYDNVFLYIYTPDCSVCRQFDEKYKKLAKIYDKHYGFVKVDASNAYGRILLRSFWGQYVPFVVLVSEKNRTASRIEPDCIMDMACLEKSIKDFQNQR